VKNLKVGDRVVVPFPIACGTASLRAGSTRCARTPTPTPGWPRSCGATRPCGIFGYSHLLGGYAGGQAEYARVPFADVGPLKVPDGMTDEQVLFLSDIFPTGYMAAEMCDIQPGDTSPCGAAARSGSSPSRAPTCSAPSA
jgi:threonine dehydrogenase-like Zn-dependent dehydrogenase